MSKRTPRRLQERIWPSRRVSPKNLPKGLGSAAEAAAFRLSCDVPNPFYTSGNCIQDHSIPKDISAPWYSGDLRRTYLRWASQKPTKVATAAQIAAPEEAGRPHVICVGRTSAGPPRSPRKWRQLRRSQPPGDRETSCDLRKTYLRWASQEPTKVATVAQIAAPRRQGGLM